MEKPVQPVKGKVTSKFGLRNAPTNGASTNHNGVDVAVVVGTQVLSPWDGKVLQTYENSAGGKQMVVQHDNGYRTGYAHLSAFIAKAGERVSQGQPICVSGNTGTSTGPHLHFTLTNRTGAKVDPQEVFSFA